MDAQQDIAIRLSGYSPRFQEIDNVERWYHGGQYEVGPYSRDYRWDEERTDAGHYIPLAKRRPYDFGIAATLVDKPITFLFDEGRFPRFVVDGDEVSEAWLAAVAEAISLRFKFIEAAQVGGSARSVFVYFKIVEGEPILDVHNGKVCQPVFEANGKTVKSLRIQYKTDGSELVARGYTGIDPDKEYWFRHEFTPEGEILYLPVEVTVGGKVPRFEEDAARSVRHNLGFVPGVWIANLKRCNGYDGVATYERAIPLIHLCNRLLSQADRAIGQACDPQAALEYDPENDVDVDSLKNQTKGGLWLMPGSVKLLEMTGKGQEIALAQFAQYQRLIGDMTGVQETDPDKLSGAAQSAEALRVLYQAVIAFCGLLRISYGDQGLVPLAGLILRVLKATPGVLKLEAKDADGKPYERTAISDNPKVKLEWGAWFEPTSQDLTTMVNTIAAAVSSSLLSQESGVEHVARFFDRDPEEELARIQGEKQERMDEAMRQMEATEGDLKGVAAEAEDEDPQEG